MLFGTESALKQKGGRAIVVQCTKEREQNL